MPADEPPAWKFLPGLPRPVYLSTASSGDLGPSGWDEGARERRQRAFFRLQPGKEKNALLPDNGTVLVCHQVHSLKVVVLLKGQPPWLYAGRFDGEERLAISRQPLQSTPGVQAGERLSGSAGVAEWVGLQDADGVITDIAGLYAAVTVADCLPILLHATRTGPDAALAVTCIGALHSGWGGTGILAVALVALGDAGFQDLEILFGPCIAGISYPVPPERAGLFRRRFGEAAVATCPDGQPGLDLVAANQAILDGSARCLTPGDSAALEPLSRLGRSARQVLANLDTAVDPELHSFRREDAKNYGRMLAMIGPAT